LLEPLPEQGGSGTNQLLACVKGALHSQWMEDNSSGCK